MDDVTARLPHAGRTEGVTAVGLLSLGGAAFLACWAGLWLPSVLGGSEGQLLLWPIAFVIAVPAEMVCFAALVLSLMSTARRRSPGRVLVVTLSAVLLVTALAALWFGVPVP